MEHIGILLTLKNSFDTINIGREDSQRDRNNMKKCIEELFSETASETAITWPQSYGKVETLGLGQ